MLFDYLSTPLDTPFTMLNDFYPRCMKILHGFNENQLEQKKENGKKENVKSIVTFRFVWFAQFFPLFFPFFCYSIVLFNSHIMDAITTVSCYLITGTQFLINRIWFNFVKEIKKRKIKPLWDHDLNAISKIMHFVKCFWFWNDLSYLSRFPERNGLIKWSSHFPIAFRLSTKCYSGCSTLCFDLLIFHLSFSVWVCDAWHKPLYRNHSTRYSVIHHQ